MADYLAMVEDGVLQVYLLNGNVEAKQVAALSLNDTSVATVATILAGLRPYLGGTVEPPGARPKALPRGVSQHITTQAVYEWLVEIGEDVTQPQVREHFGMTAREASNRLHYLQYTERVQAIPGTPYQRYRPIPPNASSSTTTPTMMSNRARTQRTVPR